MLNLSSTALPVLRCLSPSAGKETVNTLYGTRVAVLAGDFLFAQSSWLIANLENLEVSKLRERCWLRPESTAC